MQGGTWAGDRTTQGYYRRRPGPQYVAPEAAADFSFLSPINYSSSHRWEVVWVALF